MKKNNSKRWIIGSAVVGLVGITALVGYFAFKPNQTVITSAPQRNIIVEAPSEQVFDEKLERVFTPFEDTLELNTLPDPMTVSPSDFLKLDIETIRKDNLLSNQVEKLISSLNEQPEKWLAEQNFLENPNEYQLTYIDPLFGIKFVEYAYGIGVKTEFDVEQSQLKLVRAPRFTLGKNGLALLANHFLAKQSFGPEIAFLGTININNANQKQKKVLIEYFPESNSINVNMAAWSEKGFSLREKVQIAQEMLFSTYMKHWTNTYVSNLDYNQEFTALAADGRKHSTSKTDNYLSTFVNDFKTLLNFSDSSQTDFVIEELDGKEVFNNKEVNVANFIGKAKIKTSDLFILANSTNLTEVNKLREELKKIQNQNYIVGFLPYLKPNDLLPNTSSAPWYVESFYNEIQDGYSQTFLNFVYFYYLFSELVGREWRKYAFVPYYKWDETRGKSKIHGNYISETNFYGSFYKKNEPLLQFVPIRSAFAQDWFRTTSNLNLNDPKAHTVDRAFSNDIWLDLNSDQPSYLKFYKLFLNTMGYGKLITQIGSTTHQKFVENNELSKKYLKAIDKIKLANNYKKIIGFLPNLDYTGWVFVNGETKKVAKIKYLPFSNFNGLNKPATNLSNFEIMTPSSVLSELSNGQQTKKLAPYVTENFDLNLLTRTDTKMALWKDLNQNNLVEDNELIYDFAANFNSFAPTNPLPQRTILDSSNTFMNQLTPLQSVWTVKAIPNDQSTTYTLSWKNEKLTSN
ncbi:MYPU_1760 family metalloprotease [Mycoplasmopsis columbinasalis]|uniref:Uncharacterized protein n=1 Tax=Mycoplasmopsis columbinasalis TaxID=114880 RepID=A0A449BB46_9BACT|nr:hypothetical protein [Mycoplasmopsis columbinasalis]VEU78258.1 Uncharacterised protein [Mycoplasmopsis columbinasalis]